MSPLPIFSGTNSVHGAVIPIAYQKNITSSGSITFSNIPQIYQDLWIMVVGTQSGINRINLSFNGDNGNTNLYSTTVLSASAGGYASYGYTNSNYIFGGGLNNGWDSYQTASAEINILNYTTSSYYKNLISRFAGDKSSLNVSNGATEASIGTWRSKSPITSVTITAGGANIWNAGTTFELYGIRGQGQ
jgi:hypothetical protein